VRLVQPIETKWRIWLRGLVDLFPSRPLIFNTQVRPALADNLPALQFDREQKVLHQRALSSWFLTNADYGRGSVEPGGPADAGAV
jgi:hypothetical protein